LEVGLSRKKWFIKVLTFKHCSIPAFKHLFVFNRPSFPAFQPFIDYLFFTFERPNFPASQHPNLFDVTP